MRTFVMGDVHGAHTAMLQCFERCGFDHEQDLLIQLGDVVDGTPDSFACVEELLKIKHCIAIRGNHDDWFLHFLRTGFHPQMWSQGGKSTAFSYLRAIGETEWALKMGFGYVTLLRPSQVPFRHREFFERQRLYHIDDQRNCFVHAGFDRYLDFTQQDPEAFFWNRELWYAALSYEATRRGNPKGRFHMMMPFAEIFIGHTNTQNWGTDEPMKAAQIHNIDTGAGHGGRLTIMEVGTKEFWQSDPVAALYEDISRD